MILTIAFDQTLTEYASILITISTKEITDLSYQVAMSTGEMASRAVLPDHLSLTPEPLPDVSLKFQLILKSKGLNRQTL